MRTQRRPVTCLLLAAAAVSGAALASSHREAPAISRNPQVDATDFYMFRSYEPGREGFVTFVANYNPLQDAYGGPNYFALDPDGVYKINVDNTGDGEANLTFELRFDNALQNIAIPVGTETVAIPLRNAGQVFAADPATRDNLNVRESYTVRIVRTTPGGASGQGFLRNAADGAIRFGKPNDYFGTKSFPDYEAYAASFVHNVQIPGCGDGRVFVGQRKDSFAISLGEVFDLVNIANPVGAANAETDDLADKNVTAIALEVPIDCLTAGSTDVIGAWTTSELPRTRSLRRRPSFESPEKTSSSTRQVSRLGMPLVNEVVIGLKDKNRFNASRPADDLQFATYVTNPALPELLEILFGVEAPDNFPRQDLLVTFVTGIPGVNEFGFGEMQRLNVTIPPTPRNRQESLGALAGDLAGFPNGRRPGDDIVDATLRVAMGALCHAFPGAFCTPEDAPAGALSFTDGVRQSSRQFDNGFPYLTTPLPGAPSN
ncbi:MAG: DUF4331 domain-containing protein [Thermoanaerobaculia bacterium]|nr:DUF4331 domain-containing protein [Thermoanaerobaculia bacterium]